MKFFALMLLLAAVAPRSARALQESENSPDDAAVHRHRGWEYMKQHKAEEAQAEFEKSIALDPAHPGVYYGLGLVHEKKKEYAEAEKAFRRCHELAKAQNKQEMMDKAAQHLAVVAGKKH